MCMKAINEQIKELIGTEGPDTRLEIQLREELRFVAKIDTDKSDRKIAKYL